MPNDLKPTVAGQDVPKKTRSTPKKTGGVPKCIMHQAKKVGPMKAALDMMRNEEFLKQFFEQMKKAMPLCPKHWKSFKFEPPEMTPEVEQIFQEVEKAYEELGPNAQPTEILNRLMPKLLPLMAGDFQMEMVPPYGVPPLSHRELGLLGGGCRHSRPAAQQRATLRLINSTLETLREVEGLRLKLSGTKAADTLKEAMESLADVVETSAVKLAMSTFTGVGVGGEQIAGMVGDNRQPAPRADTPAPMVVTAEEAAIVEQARKDKEALAALS